MRYPRFSDLIFKPKKTNNLYSGVLNKPNMMIVKNIVKKNFCMLLRPNNQFLIFHIICFISKVKKIFKVLSNFFLEDFFKNRYGMGSTNTALVPYALYPLNLIYRREIACFIDRFNVILDILNTDAKPKRYSVFAYSTDYGVWVSVMTQTALCRKTPHIISILNTGGQ